MIGLLRHLHQVVFPNQSDVNPSVYFRIVLLPGRSQTPLPVDRALFHVAWLILRSDKNAGEGVKLSPKGVAVNIGCVIHAVYVLLIV